MFKKFALAIAGLAIAATTVFAASHAGPFEGTILARQSHMRLYAHNLGILGGMAQGKIEYNADAASAAADNIVALASINQGSYWQQGSDAESVEGTRALKAIWIEFPDILSKVEDLQKASVTMQAAAGGGLESLQGAIGGLGGACGACHKAYRQSK